MSAEDHRRYQEDLAAYLLGALSEPEAREFEAHLAGCASCQAEARWLRGTVEVLASSVEQLPAPPELRERLMSTVKEDAAAVRADAARRSSPRPLRERLGLAPLLRPAVAFGAAAVLAVGVAGGYLLGSGDDDGDTSTVAVQPTAASSKAGGRLVLSDRYAVVRVWGLPQRRGRVYQVWVRKRGSKKIEPSSLIAVRADGNGSTGVPGGLGEAAEVMVSSEPDGGSPQPTRSPVLRATL